MKRIRSGLLVLALLACLTFGAAFAQDATPEATDTTGAPETAVSFIELAGPAAENSAEISGLAWYGDYLVLLTENSFLYATDEIAGQIFALEKEDILDYLASDAPEPLEPFAVPIYGPDIVDAVSGFEVAFDGFESIVFVDAPNAFADDQVFLTIEADTISEDDPSMRGYIVWGTVEPGLRAVHLRLDQRIALPPQTNFNNMSYESMFVAGDKLVAVYEANGAAVNPDAHAYVVDLPTGTVTATPVENIEFRITDTTQPDANGRLWATNYFFPGEDFLASDNDPLFEKWGMGESQAEFDGYERLVALDYTAAGITLADVAPIQLQMTEDSRGRNWEGIAALDDRGFLIVTDRFPRTLLGFVPTGQP